MKDDSSKRVRTLASRAQLAVETATRRVTGTFNTKNGMQTDQTRRGLLALASRLTSHLAIVCVSVLAIALASLRLGSTGEASGSTATGEGGILSLGRSPTILNSGERSGKSLNGFQQAGLSLGDGSIIVRDPGMDALPLANPALPGEAAGPGGVSEAAAQVVPARGQLETYRVQPGDAISTIAQRYGLSPNTIAWANPAVEDNPELLKIGQELTILPVDGVYYTVKSGDTLGGIASRYRAEAGEIKAYPLNGLSSDVLTVGAQIVIPNGTKLAARTAAAPRPVTRRAAANPSGVSLPKTIGLITRRWTLPTTAAHRYLRRMAAMSAMPAGALSAMAIWLRCRTTMGLRRCMPI
jgi:LysM repeat protein